jgi:hypothetical protein
MAALQLRNGSYRVLFRYLGQQPPGSIGAVPETEALLWRARVEFLLTRLSGSRWAFAWCSAAKACSA